MPEKNGHCEGCGGITCDDAEVRLIGQVGYSCCRVALVQLDDGKAQLDYPGETVATCPVHRGSSSPDMLREVTLALARWQVNSSG